MSESRAQDAPMSVPERFDALIMGSGTGGTSLAFHLAAAGRRVAVVERRWIGGSCPNVGCLPTKNEIWSAKIVDLANRYAEGLSKELIAVAVDMTQVRLRKRVMVQELNAMVQEGFKKSGIELLLGEGRFIAAKTIEVRLNQGGTRLLEAEHVFLNLGTHAAVPDLPGLMASVPMTHIEVLELDRIPAHLIVLGGGYVGLELAQALRRFGSNVTIIEQGPQLLGREDPDVGAEIADVLSNEGIDVVTMAETLRVEGRSGTGVRFDIRCPSGARSIDASDVLVASGRIPNTAGIGLEVAGVGLDGRGYITVNDRLETGATGVWAVGECAGSPQFTHVSYDDYRIIRDNLAGGNRTTRDRLVPYCIFTDPQIGRVGLSETEAYQQGVSIRVARLPMASVLRARTTGETCGFMKVIVDAASDRILGFTMIGAEAGEVVAVMQAAMLGEMPYTRLRDAVLSHPTMAEGLIRLLSSVPS